MPLSDGISTGYSGQAFSTGVGRTSSPAAPFGKTLAEAVTESDLPPAKFQLAFYRLPEEEVELENVIANINLMSAIRS